MKKIIFLLLITFSLLFTTYKSNAAIDFTVSPIKYEIDTQTGATIVKTVKLTNSTNNTGTIVTGKSDFQANGTSGTPQFVRKSELVFPDQELSSWITLDTPSFEIGPKETVKMDITINVPTNATPGGHYGAVFFKNFNSENSGGSNSVGINVDYGVLILVNVEGEIITEGEVGEITIITGGGKGSGGGNGNGGETKEVGNIIKIDECEFGDFTNSNYDGKCIDNLIADVFYNKSNDTLSGSIDNDNIDNSDDEIKNFEISFEIPFDNKGNTHIKATGTIKLEDEDGKQIKGIGEKLITTDRGVVIKKEIVDYIPINDIKGNVLPGTKRIFNPEWEGFPYKTFDNDGNQVIKYWTPTEYYTKKNISDNRILMPWERVCYSIEKKTITATFDITYKDEKGEDIDFNSAKEFKVEYKQKYIGINPYVVIPFILLLVVIFLFFIIARRKKRKCNHCKKKIKKDMKICPYCGKKVK